MQISFPLASSGLSGRLLLTAAALASALALMAPAQAQDRRAVSEPAPPSQICATLSPSAQAEAGSLDTERLQSAIDHCPAGAAVHLQRVSAGAPARFVSGPLTMRSGVTLWIDRGVVLAADPDPRRYDRGAGTCGSIDRKGQGCRPFILFGGTQGGGIVGDGSIDGQGGQPMAGHGGETWWQFARRAQVEGGEQNNPRLIAVEHARDIVFHRVLLRDAPNFNVALNGVSGATFWGVRIDAPANARNTDGIDPGASEDITIAHSFIRTGDDNIAIKAGKGATRHVSITDSHFYWGHGLSIGSETVAGVSDVLVRDVTLDGTTSGLRIKSDASRGGLVSGVRYENVCLRGNRRPIDFDTRYRRSAQGDAIPAFQDIVLRHVAGDGGTLVLRGYDEAHSIDVTLDGAQFGPSAVWQVEHARIRVGAQGAEPAPPGAAPVGRPAAAPDCAGRWVPFPASADAGGAGAG
ncbi:glycosyl hydrolase family 28 protein [Paracidovorax wautersii]|uniref:glycoside hydrolase family 28 protein n=1 Tax=Paracidovorax wautersii TaxID=1177982 RepID=UPI0031E3B52C